MLVIYWITCWLLPVLISAVCKKTNFPELLVRLVKGDEIPAIAFMGFSASMTEVARLPCIINFLLDVIAIGFW
jgi:hypothetical protein